MIAVQSFAHVELAASSMAELRAQAAAHRLAAQAPRSPGSVRRLARSLVSAVAGSRSTATPPAGVSVVIPA
jgi:hypothetical protein